MTDGIIQEVFKKYLDIGTNSRILDIYLPLIQQELIEKIKQESFELERTTGEYVLLLELEKLIGDIE